MGLVDSNYNIVMLYLLHCYCILLLPLIHQQCDAKGRLTSVWEYLGKEKFYYKITQITKMPYIFPFLGRSKSNLGWTPLHLACYFGHRQVVQDLLKVYL